MHANTPAPSARAFIGKTALTLLAASLLSGSLVLYKILVHVLQGADFNIDQLWHFVTFARTGKEFTYALYIIALYFIARNFLPPRLKKAALAAFYAMLITWGIYRGLNIASIYASGTHINKTLLMHIEASTLKHFVDIKSLAIIAAALAFAYIFRLMVRPLDYTAYPARWRVLTLLLMYVFLTLGMKALKPSRTNISQSVQRAELAMTAPMTAVAPERFLADSYRTIEEVAFDAPMPREIAGKLNDFGLSFDAMDDQYPLVRKSIFTTPFPYPSKVKGSVSPNIIMLVFESLNSDLLGYKDVIPEKLTPNIDRFAAQSTRVEPLYSSSTPTINGLLAILCSHFPVFEHEHFDTSVKRNNPDLYCLPEALKQRGYHSYFVLAGNPYYTNKRPFFTSNGFDELHGAEEIKPVLGGEEHLGDWGYTDHQLLQYINTMLEQEGFEEPFFVIVETVDMHPWLRLKPDTPRFPGGRSIVQDLTYSSDIAFGQFLAGFKNSPYAGNTMLVLTADHAMQPGRQYVELMPDKEGNYYDEIPFIIKSPLHNMPPVINITSSSVDITPSILHMLGINTVNPFEGLSVFDPAGRPAHQNVLGSNPAYYFYMQDDKKTAHHRHEVSCAAPSPGPDGPTNPNIIDNNLALCQYDYWLRYKRWLFMEDRIWDSRFINSPAESQ